MTDKPEELAAWLLLRFGAASESAGGLDEDLIVGYVEDRLTDEEKQLVEAQLARDPEARALLGLDLACSPVATAGAALRGARIAAAAIVLLAVGVGIFLATREDAAPSTRAQLTALATELAYGPLTDEELAARESTERGTLVLRGPSHGVLDGRPIFRWKPVAGVDRYHLAVLDDQARVVFETDATETKAGPMEQPLGTGDYVWEVTASGPLGALSARRAFWVPSISQRVLFRTMRDKIRNRASAWLADLAEAHLALRHELFAEALGPAQRFLDANPDDELGRATLRRVHRELRIDSFNQRIQPEVRAVATGRPSERTRRSGRDGRLPSTSRGSAGQLAARPLGRVRAATSLRRGAA